MQETIKSPSLMTQKTMLKRVAHLNNDLAYLKGQKRIIYPPIFEGHVENYIGMVQIPVGLMGPIHIQGEYAQGEFYVPMATTEGALIASYTRGANVISAAGGVHVRCLKDQINRIPGFVLNDLQDAKILSKWCLDSIGSFRLVACGTSSHIDLKEVRVHVDGYFMFLDLSFSTAEAAGQNMVTFASDAICQFIEKKSPVKIKKWYIESNMAGDKKPTFYSQINGRGKKLTAQIVIPRGIVRKMLRCTPEDISSYGQMAQVASIKSGAMGSQGHFANALTAIFIACGQDIACVVESMGGSSRSVVTEDGDLDCSISLPNLVVGTVGGGTGLPVQRECLELMDCQGPGSARKLAEICAGVVLAGELSIAAAIAAGHFTWAHQNFGRKKPRSRQADLSFLNNIQDLPKDA